MGVSLSINLFQQRSRVSGRHHVASSCDGQAVMVSGGLRVQSRLQRRWSPSCRRSWEAVLSERSCGPEKSSALSQVASSNDSRTDRPDCCDAVRFAEPVRRDQPMHHLARISQTRKQDANSSLKRKRSCGKKNLLLPFRLGFLVRNAGAVRRANHCRLRRRLMCRG